MLSATTHVALASLDIDTIKQQKEDICIADCEKVMKAEKYKTFKEDFRFYNDCLVNTCKIGSNKVN